MTSYLIELTNGAVHTVQADDLLSLHNQILVLKRKNCIYDDEIVSIEPAPRPKPRRHFAGNSSEINYPHLQEALKSGKRLFGKPLK